jgi:uncharacterized protein (TIGR02996 family)
MATQDRSSSVPGGPERAYLESVCAQPDDDAPRLAYANWLESRDDHDRAEFIRLQCELARLEPDHLARFSMADRERELLRLHDAEWRSGLPDLKGIVWGRFVRGFVAAVQAATIPAFLGQADHLYDLQPVEELRLLSVRDIGRLAYDPNLAQIRALDLSRTGLKDRVVYQLTTSPYLDGLRSLDLSRNRVRGLALNALASSSAFPGIRRLVLGHCGLTANDLRDMLQEPLVLTVLQELDLAENRFGDAGAGALAACPYLTGLRALDVRRNQLSAWANGALLRRFPFVQL